MFKGGTVQVKVPFDDIGAVQPPGIDGVRAALRVNVGVHAPQLCVASVFHVDSGGLSLSCKVGKYARARVRSDVAGMDTPCDMLAV